MFVQRISRDGTLDTYPTIYLPMMFRPIACKCLHVFMHMGGSTRVSIYDRSTFSRDRVIASSRPASRDIFYVYSDTHSAQNDECACHSAARACAPLLIEHLVRAARARAALVRLSKESICGLLLQCAHLLNTEISHHSFSRYYTFTYERLTE